MKWVVFTILLASVCSQISESDAFSKYQDYLAKFQKNYGSIDEMTVRYDVFKQNLQKAYSLNADSGIEVAPTKFMSMTPQEFKKRILTLDIDHYQKVKARTFGSIKVKPWDQFSKKANNKPYNPWAPNNQNNQNNQNNGSSQPFTPSAPSMPNSPSNSANNVSNQSNVVNNVVTNNSQNNNQQNNNQQNNNQQNNNQQNINTNQQNNNTNQQNNNQQNTNTNQQNNNQQNTNTNQQNNNQQNTNTNQQKTNQNNTPTNTNQQNNTPTNTVQQNTTPTNTSKQNTTPTSDSSSTSNGSVPADNSVGDVTDSNATDGTTQNLGGKKMPNYNPNIAQNQNNNNNNYVNNNNNYNPNQNNNNNYVNNNNNYNPNQNNNNYNPNQNNNNYNPNQNNNNYNPNQNNQNQNNQIQNNQIQNNQIQNNISNTSIPSGEITDNSNQINLTKAPASWDWRLQNAVVADIHDQGECSCCWTFSTVANIEGLYAIKYGQVQAFSQQQLLDCDTVNNNGCNGGSMQNAFDYLKQNGGLETYSNYSYTGKQGSCRSNASKSSGVKIAGWKSAGTTDEGKIRDMLYQTGPLSVAINAAPLQYYTSGIGDYSESACSSSGTNHAVTLVGYGSENGKDFWIVRNSWGSNWGEKGYFRLARGKGTCGINTYVVSAKLA